MILDRIKQFIDSKGISVSAFEKSIGMSNASFGKSLKSGGAIGTDKLENILNIYPEISPIWLVTGEGSMLCENNPQRVRQTQESISLIPFVSFTDISKIDINNIPSSIIRKYYSIEEFSNLGAKFITSCIDLDSYPKYPPATLLACKIVRVEDIVPGKDYIIDFGNLSLIRTIYPSSKGSIEYVKIRTNEKETAKKDEIKGIYQIVGYVYLLL